MRGTTADDLLKSIPFSAWLESLLYQSCDLAPALQGNTTFSWRGTLALGTPGKQTAISHKGESLAGNKRDGMTGHENGRIIA
jgi:hypothetical protein